eukprot:gene499-532_t
MAPIASKNIDLLIDYRKRSPIPFGWSDDHGEIKTGIFFSVDERNNNNSIHLTLKSRKYLADFKPIDELLTLKYHGMTLLKALMASSTLIVNDFNNFEMNEMRQMEIDPDYEPRKYDWYGQLPRFYDQFLLDIGRLEFVGFCRKMIEEYCYHNFQAQLTDKLTKDVRNSFNRKLTRMSRYEASKRIISTQAMGTFISYSSFFFVDTVLSLYPAFREASKVAYRKGLMKGLSTLRSAGILMTVVNKAIIIAVSWSIGAVGYGIGAYCHTSQGGMIGGTIFELIASLVTSLLLPPAPPSYVLLDDDESEEDN